MTVHFQASSGSRLQKGSSKKELPEAVKEAAERSFVNAEPLELSGFSTEKEAKSVLLKLRLELNAQDRGLRASQPYEADDGTWSAEIAVGKKRVLTPHQ